ncbi:MAG: M14 family metallopeptidase [Gemmatimonadota bacterium]
MAERRTIRLLIPLLLVLTPSAPLAQSAQAGIPSPEEVLGHHVGAAGSLAGWAEITSYFDRLDAASPIVRVERIGATALGKPMIMAVITSERNQARLDEIRATQAALADPRGRGETEIDALIQDHPAVTFIGASLHGNEIMATQMSMQLAYDLASDPGLTRALENVVVLLVPGMNPDGLDITRDWWLRTRQTEHEGASMPWLYHHYVGHDNNRDFFMVTQSETEAVTRVLYEEWFPQVVYDVHQMGSGGARLFVPPFDDPLNPNVDPLIVRMTNVVGTQMALALTEAGKTGVSHHARFDLWWHGGARTVPARHNMVGILTEAASANYGDPIALNPDSIDQPEVGSMFPEPWEGSVWTPRDIVEYELIAATALVRLLDRQRSDFLENFVELARRQIQLGARGEPFAYVIPADQRDSPTAAEMLRVLRRGGVEVLRAEQAFEAGGRSFAPGSWVVAMAQPYRAHAKDLLEPQSYPDLRLYPDGPPAPPYDLAGWTLPMQMGVEAVEIDLPFDLSALILQADIDNPPGTALVDADHVWAALDPHVNNSHRVIHRVLADGGRVTFSDGPINVSLDGRPLVWPAGTAIVSGIADLAGTARAWATTLGVTSVGLGEQPTGRTVDRLRVGLYKPWTASIDEGWTRWLFEQWEVPFDTLHDARIRAGDLRRDFDSILIPSVGYRSIMEGPAQAHPDYAGGIGEAGAAALEAFVRAGGTLVLLDDAAEFGIERLGLRVTDIEASQDAADPDRWYAPGSLLRVVWNDDHPLAAGMPDESAVFYARGPVFEVDPSADDVSVVARYPVGDILMSGYAQGEERIAGRAAQVEARIGDGRVVLFGFRPQHRAQPHLTFKTLFNSLHPR